MKKKLLLIMISMCFGNSLFSQNIRNKSTDENFNELKFNALFLVIGALEVTYENILNETSGVGISVLLPISDDIREDVKYYISPYYRMYFGENEATGFFLEGFGMLNSVKREYFDDASNFTTDFALGIGFGGKWLTKNGFTGEISMGVGRNLFHNHAEDSELIGKAGVTLGYRF